MKDCIFQYATGDGVILENTELITRADAEAAMPTECPGSWMTGQQLDEVTNVTLDYRGGKWMTPNASHELPRPGEGRNDH